MISLDIKAETASSSTLSLSTPSDEPAVPFAEFLKKISEKNSGKKTVPKSWVRFDQTRDLLEK